MKKTTKIIWGIIVLIVALILVYILFFDKAEAPQGLNNLIIPSSWVAYNDTDSGITLSAPSGLAYVKSSTGLSLVFPTTTPYVNTHLLHELRVDIAKPAKDCVSLNAETEGATTTVVINKVNFERGAWSGVGAGNLYQGIDYITLRNGLCYRVGLFTHSTNGEGFYTDNASQIATVDAQQKRDIASIFKLFDQIAGTIRFTK